MTQEALIAKVPSMADTEDGEREAVICPCVRPHIVGRVPQIRIEVAAYRDSWDQHSNWFDLRGWGYIPCGVR